MLFTLTIKSPDLEVSYQSESFDLLSAAYKDAVKDNKDSLVDITITLSNEESIIFTHTHIGGTNETI